MRGSEEERQEEEGVEEEGGSSVSPAAWLSCFHWKL